MFPSQVCSALPNNTSVSVETGAWCADTLTGGHDTVPLPVNNVRELIFYHTQFTAPVPALVPIVMASPNLEWLRIELPPHLPVHSACIVLTALASLDIPGLHARRCYSSHFQFLAALAIAGKGTIKELRLELAEDWANPFLVVVANPIRLTSMTAITLLRLTIPIDALASLLDLQRF